MLGAMTVAIPHHRYTYAEYLAFEQTSNVKHEYLDGEIYAMAGGTPAHAALAMAIGGLLFPQLRGGKCRLYSSDLRVRVLATGLTTYPDVSIVCGAVEYDPESATTVVNPTVVFEVLSDSTEDYDRGEKLDHYRRVPSLAAVVLVSSKARDVQIWKRTDDDWTQVRYLSGDDVDLPTISARIGVDPLYDAAGV